MQENVKQETRFRVGQTVWCLLYGKGKVVNISPEEDENAYPVLVEFEAPADDCVSYTSDGKYYSDTNRTLFFSEPKIEAATEPVFEPKLVGKFVLATLKGESKVPRVMGYVVEETEDSFTIRNCTYRKDSHDVYELKEQPITFD